MNKAMMGLSFLLLRSNRDCVRMAEKLVNFYDCLSFGTCVTQVTHVGKITELFWFNELELHTFFRKTTYRSFDIPLALHLNQINCDFFCWSFGGG